MTRDEFRALLVQQGAQVLLAWIKAQQSKELYGEAVAEFADAVAPFYDEEVLAQAAEFSVEDQEQCYRESAQLVGLNPDDPMLNKFKRSFESMRHEAAEERLLQQQANAPLN